MKKNPEQRQLYCEWLKPATEGDILNEAKRMKGGRAFLFKNEEGLPVLRNEKGLKSTHEMRKETFIKRIILPA